MADVVSTSTATPSPGPRRVAVAIGGCAMIGGALTLLGWAASVPRLTDWCGSGIAMFPNTAVCAILGGLALVLQNLGGRRCRLVTRPIAAAAALIGALTLFEHLSRINLGLDTLMFRPSWGQRAADAPMRMGPPASITFLLVGVSLVLLTFGRRARSAAVPLALTVLTIASLSIIGYLYGADEMYTLPRLTGIAFQTAAIIFALGLGIIASVPEHQPLRIILERGASGMLMRLAVPCVAALSVALGWARTEIQHTGFVDAPFGTALRTVVEMALLIGLLWWAAFMVRDHELALRESEASLRRAKEAAEAANAAKDAFLATLSHELRTPLTPVLATLSEWETAPNFPGSLRHDTQMIRRNIELEARLIDDLLDLTRIAKGKLALNREVLDLHRLVQSIVAMYSTELQNKSLRLGVRLDAVEHFVRADPGRLQQAFWNLLKNAAKFTDAGGRVEITTSNDADGRVRLEVRDTGIGIAPAALARLFRPFEQGGDDIAKRYGGLGLGLMIAKTLVTAQQGEITADSDGVGRGATFAITLPSVPATVPAAKTVAPAGGAPVALASSAGTDGGSGKPLRLLLVEDHVDTARILSRLLRNRGHQVELAGSLSEAMQAVGRGSFDLLLSDVGLPDGSGVDLIRQIRELYGRAIPAVALSGYGMEDDVARCIAAGFDHHLTKPVNFQQLEAAIQQVAGIR